MGASDRTNRVNSASPRDFLTFPTGTADKDRRLADAYRKMEHDLRDLVHMAAIVELLNERVVDAVSARTEEEHVAICKFELAQKQSGTDTDNLDLVTFSIMHMRDMVNQLNSAYCSTLEG